MNTYSKLYWLTRLDGMHGLFITLTVVFFLAAIAIIIFTLASRDFDEFYTGDKLKVREEFRNKFSNKLKWIFPIAFISLFASILIPTRNEAIFIVAGGKTIDWAMQDTSLCKIPDQTTLILSEFLDKQIKELKNSK